MFKSSLDEGILLLILVHTWSLEPLELLESLASLESPESPESPESLALKTSDPKDYILTLEK